jgi:hypothetical protein
MEQSKRSNLKTKNDKNNINTMHIVIVKKYQHILIHFLSYVLFIFKRWIYFFIPVFFIFRGSLQMHILQAAI